MSPTLGLNDSLTTTSTTTNTTPTTTTTSQSEQFSSSVAGDRTNRPGQNSLSCDSSSGVVINNIIIGDSGDAQQQSPSFSNTTTTPHPPAASFWTPGLSPVDDEFVNYGSCNINNSINQEEVDQIKQTFLNGGSYKLNKDIESLCTGQSNYHLPVDRSNSKTRWWRHPKFKENWKIFFAAFGLLVVGIGLITMGIVVSVLPDIDFQSYVFFIAGTICFIPGAYHVVYLYFALSGRKGYDFHQLPLFN